MIKPAAIALGIVLLLAATVAVPATAQEPRASLPDVEDEVMCTICGTLLAESDSPQAERERALIRRLIAEGKDKDQIKDALVAEYGPRVLATPSGHGFDLVAWLVPGAAILLAAVAIAFGLRRTLRQRSGSSAEPQPLDPGDAARLEADLSRHEL
jgi:cytochrome c-type biogenesis protein CcmH/NrfF